MHPKTDNTATAYTWLLGNYTGSTYQKWRLQIDTAGAIGTATWKLSRDTGTNWDLTLQKTFDADNNNQRISISSGLSCVFFGTFGDGDYWDIEVFPATDQPTGAKMSYVECER